MSSVSLLSGACVSHWLQGRNHNSRYHSQPQILPGLQLAAHSPGLGTVHTLSSPSFPTGFPHSVPLPPAFPFPLYFSLPYTIPTLPVSRHPQHLASCWLPGYSRIKRYLGAFFLWLCKGPWRRCRTPNVFRGCPTQCPCPTTQDQPFP